MYARTIGVRPRIVATDAVSLCETRLHVLADSCDDTTAIILHLRDALELSSSDEHILEVDTSGTKIKLDLIVTERREILNVGPADRL